MKRTNYNPDVLSCLANLSNDEVFTPPNLVNQMLDMLPSELWKDKNTKFLDPVSKTGVFLREIAKRLDKGLEKEIPNKQERLNHIFNNQLYGIAITELTSLLSRRSLYCSKEANGKYSVAQKFEDENGNILFDRMDHSWVNGNCSYCGASEEVYSRSSDLETHAYQFIHTDKPEETFNNMKFDVIIGNPPYQLNDGGGTGIGSAVPLYHKFVERAIKLNPRYLSMIIPSRWFSGGRGLDGFRNEMLNDKRIRTIHDYPDATECFPGIDLGGGVCFFLWDRDNEGQCTVVSNRGNIKSEMERPLLENNQDIFIRYNEAISIIHKVARRNETSFSSLVSSSKPFGFRSYVRGENGPSKNSIKLYSSAGISYVKLNEISQNKNWINKHKVYVSKAYGERLSSNFFVTGKPFVGEPNSVCTETYLVVGPFESFEIVKNVISYMQSRFFRFLVLQKKNTQNSSKSTYSFATVQNFNEKWTDEKLYKKYKLTKEEITFIESMVRPME
jgi:site-specific DNA-methyltransferase (adenine-specific)